MGKTLTKKDKKDLINLLEFDIHERENIVALLLTILTAKDARIKKHNNSWLVRRGIRKSRTRDYATGVTHDSMDSQIAVLKIHEKILKKLRDAT